jgi:arsenite-transporting ATPase
MTILPGMEELFSLLRIKRYKTSGLYDALVLDTAPTGETLRLLSLPDTLAWGMKAVKNVTIIYCPAAQQATFKNV